MTTIAQVRGGLASVIFAGTGLRADGYVGDQQLATPCARVMRAEFDPNVVFGNGKARIPFRVLVFAGRAADRAAEKLLDTYCELTGSTSILAAVESASRWTTASVTIDHARVTRMGEAQVLNVSGIDYLTVDLDVEVAF